uniref:Bestrophin homolog n=1 Tax=Ditylum brightwellii TaxID=49249 RepID=A0A7S4T2M8_9STRA
MAKMKHFHPRRYINKVILLLFSFLGFGASLSTSHLITQRQRYGAITSLSAENVRPGSMDDAIKSLGRVPYGEASRKYRRTVYTHKDWLNHRSNDRLVGSLISMFYSGVIRQVKNKIFLVASVAVFVTVWDEVLINYYPDLPHVCLPTIPFLLSSPALGLLLVFRTNASYQRWLDGARLWGTVKSHSRNIVRMSSTFTDLSQTQERQAIDDLAIAVWILSRSIMNRLMGYEDEDDYQEQIRKECPDGEFANQLIEENDRASVALMEVSLVLDNIPVDEKRRVEIDKSLVIIGDALVSCDRIFSSPVPLVYTRHTARFLSMWMLLMPLAVHDEFQRVLQTGLAVIPTAAVLSLFLFGIEELAVQLEEPFTILPLQKYCDEIMQSNKVMIEWGTKSRKMKSVKN